MAKFEDFVGKLLRLGEGYVDHPLDGGGPTKYGVILSVWKELGHNIDGDGEIDADDLKLLNEDDAKHIVKEFFWDYFLADRINDQDVAEFLANWGYSSPRIEVAKKLQEILKIAADGIVGEQTLRAVNDTDQEKLLNNLKVAREESGKQFSTSEIMLSRIKEILKEAGYVLYTKPYQLNIVGLRSKNTNSNTFDDEIHVFYTKPNGQWDYYVYPATTDPGTFWLNNPAYDKGTAILAQGQYVDAYALGLHRGKYEALVQVKPVTVMRDYDRNSLLDFINGTKQTGIFGINIHRAEGKGTTKFINKYSAGCQVFQNAEDFARFITLCEQHRKLYGNTFSYTLVDFRSLSRVTLKRIVTTTTLVAAVALGIILKSELY